MKNEDNKFELIDYQYITQGLTPIIYNNLIAQIWVL